MHMSEGAIILLKIDEVSIKLIRSFTHFPKLQAKFHDPSSWGSCDILLNSFPYTYSAYFDSVLGGAVNITLGSWILLVVFSAIFTR